MDGRVIQHVILVIWLSAYLRYFLYLNFSKRGTGDPAMNVSAGLGSKGTHRLSTGIGGAEGGTDFNVQLSTLTTNGIQSMNMALTPTANPNPDRYHNNSFSANIGHDFNADHRVSASLFGSDGNNIYSNPYNASPTDVSSDREQIWKLSLVSDDQLTETWHSKLQLATGVDQYRDLLNLDNAGVTNKVAVLERVLNLHSDYFENPLECLRRVGGFEIAALTGAYLTCAQRGIPVLVDGFIATAAALTTVHMTPDSANWLIYGHGSAEPGHARLLEALDATPLLSLGMRLGEGSGAATALPLLRLACALHNGMATFAEAAVSEKL